MCCLYVCPVAAVLNKSKELQHLSSVMEERETFATQARALQELLRQNAEELERYKQMVAAPTRAAGVRAADTGEASASAGL